MDVAFRPEGDTWQSLSPRLITARRLVLALVAAAVLVVAIVVAVTPSPKWVAAVIALFALAILIIGWPWIGRRVRSWGYAERADDLVTGLVDLMLGRSPRVDL